MRSSASSSASRMVIDLVDSGIDYLRVGLSQGQGHNEGRSLSRNAVCGDRPAVPFGNFPANCQTDARALVSTARMQPLEDVEDPVQVLFLEPDPIVMDQ